MKKNLLITVSLFLWAYALKSQTLTLVTGKKLYEHHSSALSGAPYGFVNSNAQSGYDFVNHVNVPSGNASMAANRDMVEHNGYFSWNGSTFGWQFGFTSNVSNIGMFNYQGNNQTKFYLNNSVSFSSLNTVNDLISAYNSTLATKMDTAVVVGNIYIVKVRNTDMYLAMRITAVSNLSAAQVVALDNNQQVMASVFFEFEYKYGTLCTASSVSVSSTSSIICAGQQVTLTAAGSDNYTWSNGATDPEIVVSPTTTTTYTVVGTKGDCTVEKTIVQKVSVCVGMNELSANVNAEVYPNPFNNSIIIASTIGNHYEIRDMLGNTLNSGQIPDSGLLIVDTEKYARGIYIISLSDGKSVYRTKVIKD